MRPDLDNPALLAQDCSRPLFRWFLSRIDWKRILNQMVCRHQWTPINHSYRCTRCGKFDREY